MMKSIFDPLFRLIKKNRLDFFLNLTGLSVAMVIFIFITLYVNNETSFDKYHPNADKIFRLTTSITSPGGQRTDMALANTTFAQILENKCPEITDYSCIDIGGDYTVKFQDKVFEDIIIRAATPSIFKFFSYPVLEGKADDFLRQPNTIVLTKSLSGKIFKDENPMGQIVTVGEKDYEVTGIIEDLPGNTDVKFSALSSSTLNGNEPLVEWGDYFVYLEIADCSIATLENKVDTITSTEYKELLQKMGGYNIEHHLQPLSEIHFDNSLLADLPKGNKTNVIVFSIIAAFILIIAGINYINLTVAQLQKRQKEFSIRKTIGCNRKWIIYHVLSESIISSVFAIVLAIFFAILLLPQFNKLFGQSFDLYSIGKIIVPLVFLFLLFGIISGLYPAVKSIRSEIAGNAGFNRFGKTLVTFQNVISIAMIACVFLIWSQIQFMKNYDLGFNKEQIIVLSLPSNQKQSPGMEPIRQELSKVPEVKAIAFGGGGTNLGATGNWLKSIMVTKDANENDIQFVANQPLVDENYIDLMGMKIIDGRNFSELMQEDKNNAVIVNETYVKTMGWTEPLGKYVFDNNQLKVIGVVKDFHFDGLHNPIEPLFFRYMNNEPAFVFLKAEPRNLNLIREQWGKAFKDVPFKYTFMDQHMADLYQKDQKEMTIFSYLTLIAILISGLGLYGLTAHFIINRTKEIGIRKVNGAKITEIMGMLNKDSVKWVVVAFVIATPIAWYAMYKWLENFAYKTALSWWIFALAGLLALGIALLTVSWQSWRAATRNPVEALRYE